jgi:hypothetical protein
MTLVKQMVFDARVIIDVYPRSISLPVTGAKEGFADRVFLQLFPGQQLTISERE